MTRGEASDLIGTKIPANQKQIRILKYFGIQPEKGLSDTGANRKIDEIFLDPANVEKWDNRPLEKEQKEFFNFFKIPIKRGMTFREAETFQEDFFEDEEKEEVWLKHLEEVDDREAWIEDNFEYVNEEVEYYDCKRIPKALFIKVINSLEADGLTLEQLENDMDLIFQRALALQPSLSLQPLPPTASPMQKQRNLYLPPGQNATGNGFTQKVLSGIKQIMVFLARVCISLGGLALIPFGSALAVKVWQEQGTFNTPHIIVPIGFVTLGVFMLWVGLVRLRK